MTRVDGSMRYYYTMPYRNSSPGVIRKSRCDHDILVRMGKEVPRDLLRLSFRGPIADSRRVSSQEDL